MEHFRFALHRIFRMYSVDLCSAIGDLNAEERKVSNDIV